MPWNVVYLPEARRELAALPRAEAIAVVNVELKLQALGPALSYPHSSAVRGAPGLRELRPRSGHSPWRAFYQRIGDAFVVAAVGPEAQVDQRGFERRCRAASTRLARIAEE